MHMAWIHATWRSRSIVCRRHPRKPKVRLSSSKSTDCSSLANQITCSSKWLQF